MKTERNILTAFLLNLFFSCFEFAGGLVTGSIAILSDAVHDLGDAAAIGISWWLERKSSGAPDESHTYGYARYSVLGSLLTTLILLVGSALVIYHALLRLFRPAPIHYDGMILFALVGVAVNLLAAYVTREGDSLNQKAVNLHMLEDVLGWAVVLAGAVVMRFTDLAVLDPLLSIGVALFILFHAAGYLKEALAIFLEQAPAETDPHHLKEHLSALPGVLEIHHLHLWTLDGHRHCATLHAVTDGDPAAVKAALRKELEEFGIGHATLELETPGEVCPARECRAEPHAHSHHHHHHHHH